MFLHVDRHVRWSQPCVEADCKRGQSHLLRWTWTTWDIIIILNLMDSNCITFHLHDLSILIQRTVLILPLWFLHVHGKKEWEAQRKRATKKREIFDWDWLGRTMRISFYSEEGEEDMIMSACDGRADERVKGTVQWDLWSGRVVWDFWGLWWEYWHEESMEMVLSDGEEGSNSVWPERMIISILPLMVGLVRSE